MRSSNSLYSLYCSLSIFLCRPSTMPSLTSYLILTKLKALLNLDILNFSVMENLFSLLTSYSISSYFSCTYSLAMGRSTHCCLWLSLTSPSTRPQLSLLHILTISDILDCCFSSFAWYSLSCWSFWSWIFYFINAISSSFVSFLGFVGPVPAGSGCYSRRLPDAGRLYYPGSIFAISQDFLFKILIFYFSIIKMNVLNV